MALNWSTSTDWDNAVDEVGMVHESTTNTDYTDSTILRKGYPSDFTAVGHWPLDENSGSTANDITGNGYDGSFQGSPNQGQTGLLDTTAYSFDGSDDLINIADSGASGAVPSTSTFTLSFWVYDLNPTGKSYFYYDNSNNGIRVERDNGTVSPQIWNGNNWVGPSTSNHNGNEWEHYTVVFDNGTVEGYRNGNSFGTSSPGSQSTRDNGQSIGGITNDGFESFANCKMDSVIWEDTVFTSGEVQDLYDTVASTSYLTTATKSFSTSRKPNLDALDYNLNGESITVDVIGSPNTAEEEIVSKQLDGSSSYNLSWSNSHTDFRVKIKMSTTDVTKTPTFNSIDLIKSAETYTSSISTFTTASGRYVSGTSTFYTSGITYSIDISAVSTDTVTLQIIVDSIKDVQGAVFRYLINGDVKDEVSVSATGTYETTVNSLSPSTSYTYTAEEVRNNNINSSKSTSFKTASEDGVNIQYDTVIDLDTSSGINETPIIDAIGNGDALDIVEFELKDSAGNVLYNSSSSSQLSTTQNSARQVDFETVTFNTQTSDSDTIAAISLLSSLSDEVVDVSLSDISGGQRIEIVIPVNSN